MRSKGSLAISSILTGALFVITIQQMINKDVSLLCVLALAINLAAVVMHLKD